MFKKILLIAVTSTVIGLLVFGAVNRTLAQNSQEGSRGSGTHSGEYVSATPQPGELPYNGQGQGQGRGQGQGQGRGNGGQGRGQGQGQGNGGQLSLPPATPGELSAAESEALIYLREEEKLAHDVYVALYEKWGLRVFQNISQSEQTHTEAIKTLLDRYGLADPASNTPGIFTNSDLQSLYNELAGRGGLSVVEALKVGAAIEEIDILDLEKRLAETDNADIRQVFNSLMQGSYNHLQAFASNISAQTGETYQPQYLSLEAYQNIINSSASNGRGGGNRGGRP